MSDKYQGLREKLSDTHFPTLYMYKFLIPNKLELIAEVKALAEDENAIKMNYSKNGLYVSLTFKETKQTIEDIITVYKKAELIENLMAL